jgi:hypothetical protein
MLFPKVGLSHFRNQLPNPSQKPHGRAILRVRENWRRAVCEGYAKGVQGLSLPRSEALDYQEKSEGRSPSRKT